MIDEVDKLTLRLYSGICGLLIGLGLICQINEGVVFCSAIVMTCCGLFYTAAMYFPSPKERNILEKVIAFVAIPVYIVKRIVVSIKE